MGIITSPNMVYDIKFVQLTKKKLMWNNPLTTLREHYNIFFKWGAGMVVRLVLCQRIATLVPLHKSGANAARHWCGRGRALCGIECLTLYWCGMELLSTFCNVENIWSEYSDAELSSALNQNRSEYHWKQDDHAPWLIHTIWYSLVQSDA